MTLFMKGRSGEGSREPGVMETNSSQQPAAAPSPSPPWEPPGGHQPHSTPWSGLCPGADDGHPGQREARAEARSVLINRPPAQPFVISDHIHQQAIHWGLSSLLHSATHLDRPVAVCGRPWVTVHGLPVVCSLVLCPGTPPVYILLSCFTRYLSYCLSSCLSGTRASVMNSQSVLPTAPVSGLWSCPLHRLHASTHLSPVGGHLCIAGPIIHHLSAYVSFMLPAIYYPCRSRSLFDVPHFAIGG